MDDYPRELQHGSGVVMMLDLTRLLLAFKEALARAEVETVLPGLGLDLEDANDKQESRVPRPIEIVNHTNRRFWVRTLRGRSLDRAFLDVVEAAFGGRLDWIGPVYRLGNIEDRRHLLCPLPNVLVIKPALPTDQKTDSAFSRRLSRLGLKEIPEKSRYLSGFRYYVCNNPTDNSSYRIRAILLEQEKQFIHDVRFETMPLLVPTAVVPNDVLFPQQWDMTQIQAGGAGITGWDISTGANAVVVCVLDEGCDLTHPDLQFSTPGINLGTMMPDGSPTGNHGTACAGIAAGRFDNALGIAGVAGNCQIMPLAFDTWSDVEVAAGINFAADNGARVISMSFGFNGWDPVVIDPAIQHAFNTDVVMCVATHNYDGPITYPATNPLVMACGASDQIDNRKSPTSPDGETWWGSNFGPEISVVAPGVLIPTTDRQGADGYNPAVGAAGDFFLTFNGTSSATPHVAGLAALLRSLYPALTNVQTRRIIERTVEKVGVVAYADTPGYPSGTWNQEMGYGRINVLRALDYADVMIRDYPGDTGVEPSTPPGGNFWSLSDIVVRITDDNVFTPNDPIQSSNVERGQTNYLYVQITNNGPRDARNLVVNARITPYVGLEFVFPADWTAIDANHVAPTPVSATFAAIPAGTSAIAKFTISAAQVEDLWGWVSGMSWHPCLLASVTSDNDHAFGTAALTGSNLIVRRNNIAQRNLSVIDVLAGASVTFPFVAGSRFNVERVMELTIDRSQLAKEMTLLLSLDEDGEAFPQVDFKGPVIVPSSEEDSGIVFLQRARIEATLGWCRGVLTLEKGSRFDCLWPIRVQGVTVEGGEVVLRSGKRFVEVREAKAVVRVEKLANQLYPMALQTSIPRNAQKGQRYTVKVSQRNEKQDAVGGASVVYYVE